ncbi:MAG TPA: NAD(P)H-dependent oxidoreductase subunit E [Candidatus Udaeobacter sp.]|nr:NAD(P)H-dependent oxidoreductase subunit E [Candidatus Udaeobacter sp.]
MEIHLTSDAATQDEQFAVDLILGEPVSQWAGLPRGAARDEHFSSAQPYRRDFLLPVLHSIQSHIGWLSPGALNYVAVRLDVPPAEVHSVASFYDLFRLQPTPPITLHVCDDIACRTKGAETLCAGLDKSLGIEGLPCLDGKAAWFRSPCLGLCDQAPVALLKSAGQSAKEWVIARATSASIHANLQDCSEGGDGLKESQPLLREFIPQFGSPQLRLLRRVGQGDPANLQEYLRTDGYEALRRAMQIGPEAVVQEVIESRLLGRGGAAFPTGKKWEAVFRQRRPGSVHYVICNADESEPGTFKDRVLMKGDPLALIEGLTIAAFAVGAEKGFIYIRGEYPESFRILPQAIQAARENNFLGNNILGGSFSFDIELRRGAGAYICGEETALFNSIEGFRGEPRNKPPFPTQSGLFRRPTIVNNVETLINIPEIILKGGAAYARIGTQQSTGYRLFCLSGHVVRPGTYEVAFGATLRQLIEMAGGIGGTGKLQAVLLGGAAGSFVAPQELDTPLTFEGVRVISASLGSGVVMLFDDSVDLKDILTRIAKFFRHESCGQCVPCRVGTIRQEEILRRLTARTPNGSVQNEIALLKEAAQAMRDASICGLGQTAPAAILSAIERWSLFS